MGDIYIELTEHLGDIIACEPVVRYLKEKKPDKKICWIINKKYKDVIIANPYIDNVIEVNNLYDADCICADKRKNGDEIIDMHYDGRICIEAGKIHTNLNGNKINEFNIFENNRSILQAFSQIAGLEELNEKPDFYLQKNISVSRKIPSKYVVFHCKSNTKSKDWTPEKWNLLAKKILKLGMNIVEIGMEPIIKSRNPNYYNCTDINDIQQIAMIIKNAHCFIGIDSAFAHIANCFDIYSILIFGKYMNFKKYNPYSGNFGKCKNCTIIYTHETSTCIPVSAVYNEFENFIKSKKQKLNRRIFVPTVSVNTILQYIFSLKNEIDIDDCKKRKVLVLLGTKIRLN